jgi:hypothetical protein
VVLGLGLPAMAWAAHSLRRQDPAKAPPP